MPWSRPMPGERHVVWGIKINHKDITLLPDWFKWVQGFIVRVRILRVQGIIRNRV